jgi:hypothetical protein
MLFGTKNYHLNFIVWNITLYRICLLLENALNFIGLELEEKLNAHIGAMNGPSNDHLEENIDPNVQQKRRLPKSTVAEEKGS